MTVFAEIVLVVSAVILSYFLFSLRKRGIPEIFLHNLSYNPHTNVMKLTLENYGTKPVHVKPAFRRVQLKSAEEWKNHVADDGVPMLSGREMSLIKGYELLCQVVDTIEVAPQAMHEIDVELEDSHRLQPYDNVRVSMLCGENEMKLTDSIHSTIRVKMDEVFPPHSIEEILPTTDISDIIKHVDFDKIIEPQSYAKVSVAKMSDISSAKKPSIRKRVGRNKFPLEATCVCCGQVKWLKWLVDGKHVCGDCRDFLHEKITSEYSPDELAVKFTARQDKILDAIGAEGELPVKEILNITGESRSTVTKELKSLVESGAVKCKKDKNRLLYSLV